MSNRKYKSTLLNIDSSFRNMYPKNIYKSDIIELTKNPLYFTQNSNKILINCPNHNFNIGNHIIIENVIGESKIISSNIYLINNFNYAVIYIKDHNINENYENDIYIDIELLGEQTESNNIDNILFNYLIGIKKIYILANLINENIDNYKSILESIIQDDINTSCLFIKLPHEYNSNNTYYTIKQNFKISDLHIGGIKLGYINANYPINDTNYQSSHIITNVINKDYFEITINYKSFINIKAGGQNIKIFKVINTIDGYPEIDNYIINFKKSFSNVVNIELISSEFPYVDNIIKKNINDKLYWQHIEDGETLYNIQIEEGFYTTSSLLDKIKSYINSTERITSSNFNKIYNYMDITLEPYIHKITFNPYSLSVLSNPLSIKIISINSIEYYVMTVFHPNNLVNINDIITISNATDVTFNEYTNNLYQSISIDGNNINKDHIIYSVNIITQSYDIILGEKKNIVISIVNYQSGGGINVTIKSKSKVRFLFDKPDTLGSLLGFKNVGNNFSITDFKSEINNQDKYIYYNNLNSVGNNIDYNNGYFNLAGGYNYMLMYLNDIEYIYNNNNLPSAFAKIMLSGNPGDILFNTFVQYPNDIYSNNFPISTLSEITVKFLYPDGSRVNFRNINHSFTLKITEEIINNT